MDVSSNLTLSQDILCTGDGLHVTAEDITIDLNGFSLVGSGIGVAIDANSFDVTVLNGSIVGFERGVSVSYPGSIVAKGLSISETDIGIFALAGGDITVLKSSLRHNRVGIAALQSPSYVSIERSILTDNFSGVLLVDQEGGSISHSTLGSNNIAVSGSQSNDITVSRCTLADNGVGLSIFQGFNATFIHNRVVGGTVGVSIEDAGNDRAVIAGNTFTSTTVGVRLGGSNGFWVGDDTAITKNRFVDNGAAGILIDLAIGSADGVVIANNKVNSSGFLPNGTTDHLGATVDDGIHIVGNPALLTDISLGSNHVMRNADFGIEADGVTDAGRNKGLKNGNPAQCLGVVC
jgi:hypothetical protein